MKKMNGVFTFLEIVGILIGIGIIVSQGVRLYKGLTYTYDETTIKTVVDEVRVTVRESDVANYIKMLEIDILEEIYDGDDSKIYNINDYNVSVSKTKPTAGVFSLNNGYIKEALLKYEIKNNIYYACYTESKTEIKANLNKLSTCEDLKQHLKEE